MHCYNLVAAAIIACTLALGDRVVVDTSKLEETFSKYARPAAVGAYKDIIDAASKDPVKVLGRAWKQYDYDEFPLADGAYVDVIERVEDPKEVLGKKTFDYTGESYSCQELGSSNAELCPIIVV